MKLKGLNRYLKSEESEGYHNGLEQDHTFIYLLSILVENDGDWNKLDFSLIKEEDILKLSRFVNYQIQKENNYSGFQVNPLYERLENNYDQAQAFKNIMMEYKSNAIDLGVAIDHL